MSHGNSVSLIFHRTDPTAFHTYLIDILSSTLFVLGIIGNVLGLFLFSSSRRSRRISSTYVILATSSSIINLLCVIRYASIVHSVSRKYLQQIVGETWWACKGFEFSFCLRVISAWITLYWMFERVLCVSKTLKSCLNAWKSYNIIFLFPSLLILLILVSVIGPPVYMFQPGIRQYQQINDTYEIEFIRCTLDSNASPLWQKYFHELHMGFNHFTIRCAFSELIPTAIILLFNSYIIGHVTRTRHHLNQTKRRHPRQEQLRTTSWMNIVLILHSSLFLSSLVSHIIGHFAQTEAHEIVWVALAVLINCSLNFYIYCLSGEAFRNEIRRLFHRFITVLI